jgi:2-methylcitrate dehydratase PrpD
MESQTEFLADYICKARFEDFPRKVVEKAKACIMDSIGCALGGYRTELGRRVINVMKELDGRRESTIIGDGEKLGCLQASFANTYLANLLDFDDTYKFLGHPNNTIVPTGLALGERFHVSGLTYLTAVIVGYEVSIRIGLALIPTLTRLKTINLPVTPWQTIGAATVAARLLNLSKAQVVDAIGIAGNYASAPVKGVKVKDQPYCAKDGKMGHASASGVLAAILAKSGIVGNRRILDTEANYWVATGSDRCDFESITKDLGREYEINGVSFKPYPCCRYLHPALDAVKSIMAGKEASIGDIDAITVRTIELTPVFHDTKPQTLVDLQYNLPYPIAMLLLGVKPGLDWYAEDQIEAFKSLGIGNKVRIVVDPLEEERMYTEGKWGATVEFTLKSGKTIERYVKYALGEPEKPMTDKQLKEKFRDMVGAKSRNRAEKISKDICKLEELKDLSDLTELLHM